jgi:hypothetical protein
VSLGQSQLAWFARTRKCKAGRDPRQRLLREAGPVEAFLGCRHDGDHGGLEPQPDVRRAGHGVCEPRASNLARGLACGLTQPGAAPGSTAVDTEEE